MCDFVYEPVLLKNAMTDTVPYNIYEWKTFSWAALILLANISGVNI